MGVDRNFQMALTKALMAANLEIKPGTGVLLSIADQHKAEAVSLIRDLTAAGCLLYATEGTAAMISAMGLSVSMTTKRLSEGHPNVTDVIEDGSVSAVVNTISGSPEVMRDGFYIRRAAVEKHIPCFTSMDTARAAAESLSVELAAYNIATIGEYLKAD